MNALTNISEEARRLLERQRHRAQVAQGFHLDQRAFIGRHHGRALARHMDRLGLGGDGSLYGSDLFSVGVHPLQPRALRDLDQFVDRQFKGLDLGQFTGGRRRCGNGRRCYNRGPGGCRGRRGCWRGRGRRGRCKGLCRCWLGGLRGGCRLCCIRRRKVHCSLHWSDRCRIRRKGLRCGRLRARSKDAGLHRLVR